MHPPAPALVLEEGQRDVLEAWPGPPAAPHREVVRARALLLAAEGLANTAIAAQVGVAPSSVVAWRERFASRRAGKVRPGPQGARPKA